MRFDSLAVPDVTANRNDFLFLFAVRRRFRFCHCNTKLAGNPAYRGRELSATYKQDSHRR